MGNYAAEVRINTKIDTSQMLKLQNQIDRAAMKVDALTKKYEELKNQKIPTSAFSELESKLQVAQDELKSLIAEEERYEQLGLNIGAPFENLIEKEAEARLKIEDIEYQIQKLKDAGKAFRFTAGDPEKIAKAAQELRIAKGELKALVTKQDELNRKQDTTVEKSQKVSDGFKKIASTAKKGLATMSGHVKQTSGLLSTMASRLKGLLLSLLIFNWISKGFNAMVSGIKDGFKNLVKYSDDYNQSVSALKSANTQMKNSFATAFMPIVQTVIPHLISLMNYITLASNAVARFTATLTGKSTWIRATQVQEDYAASLDGTAAAAKKAAGALASFDTLEVLNKNDASGGASGTSEKDMFEEVPVDQEVVTWLDNVKEKMNPIIDYLAKLKDIFMQGFWDGLGDWEYRWESIKDSIASIKESLIDIFTDPVVLSAADGWMQSVVYMLGSLSGSMASIGLTIAANLLGGIEKYLEQNKDRIKDYWVSMFDIGTEVNYMFADLFDSIAYVFEAFASEDGQQLTANLIGIFLDTFMGIMELALKIFRDVANIMIQPFVDNKEALRTALEGFLTVLSDVTGTIKDGIDETFDKLNEVYDEHFKPFFDSIAQGLSDLLGHFLEFWNGNVQPILENWAALFDDLWKSHLQPFINNIIELLGSLVDLLKALWENILKPFIGWIIEYVLPQVMFVIDVIVESVMIFVGFIADIAGTIINILKGIIDFLAGVFSGDWELVFQSLLDIGESFIDLLKEAIRCGILLIEDIVDFSITKLKEYASLTTELGKNMAKGLANGILSLKDEVVEASCTVGMGMLDKIKNLFGIHSPSTVMAEIGGFLIEGLANGVSGAISLVTDIISGLVDKVLGMFSFDKWSEAGENMITSITDAITEFKTIWNEGFNEWMAFNNELYFGYDVWYEQFENIMLAYADVNTEFMAEWQTNTDTWWNTMVMPFFTVEQWKIFGTNMKTGIMTGFKAIVNEIGGVLNNVIYMFDEAFEKLEEAINDLIDSYNASASTLGTSKLSKVHYKAMGGVQIPALANGAVIRGGNPFLAILGDQRTGQTNIEAPISTIREAVRDELAAFNIGGGQMKVVLNLNGERVGEAMLDDLFSVMNRRGYEVDVLRGV